jgi:hypothetical protein
MACVEVAVSGTSTTKAVKPTVTMDHLMMSSAMAVGSTNWSNQIYLMKYSHESKLNRLGMRLHRTAQRGSSAVAAELPTASRSAR